MDREKRLFTVREAAERLHLTDNRVTQLLREKKLPGVKFGRKWLIPEEALTLFMGLPTSSRKAGQTMDQFVGQATPQLKDVPEASAGIPQYSLAQLAHFDDVRKHEQLWCARLNSWSLDSLWVELAEGTQTLFTTRSLEEIQTLFVKDQDQARCFPMLRGHLLESQRNPALGKWWEELKKVVIPFEESLVNLWHTMLKEAQEQTGLALKPRLPAQTEEGLTPDFFRTILHEQKGSLALKEAVYSSRSLTFEKDAQVWSSVEEGIRRLAGEPPPSAINIVVSGGEASLSIRAISPVNTRVVERIPTPIERPLKVLFYLRYGLDLVFVRSPDQLPKVEQEHKRLREVYGPKLAELVPKEKQIIDLVSQFRSQLREALQLWPYQWFPGHCPSCPS